MPRLDPVEELNPVKLTIGSQWWSIKAETYREAMELLEKNVNIEKYFRKIECSDESFFGSIFTCVSKSPILKGTTYVKWIGRGRPQNLKIAQFEIDQEDNNFIFARKFSAKSFEDRTLRSIKD
jgi:hypothetical protein